MSMTNNNHYVSQFYLKNFEDPKTHKIAYFTKGTRRCSFRPPKNLGSESGIYTQDLERYFGDLERQAAPVIRKLATLSNKLNKSETDKLFKFMSMTLARNPHFLRAEGRTKSEILENIINNVHYRERVDALIIRELESMQMVLGIAPKGSYFLTNDFPVNFAIREDEDDLAFEHLNRWKTLEIGLALTPFVFMRFIRMKNIQDVFCEIESNSNVHALNLRTIRFSQKFVYSHLGGNSLDPTLKDLIAKNNVQVFAKT